MRRRLTVRGYVRACVAALFVVWLVGFAESGFDRDWLALAYFFALCVMAVYAFNRLAPERVSVSASNKEEK